MIDDQNALLAEPSELEHLYRIAPVGLCLTDRDHRYVRIDQKLADINGKSVAEHLGRTIQEVIPDLAPQVESMFQRVIDSEEPILDHEVRGSTAAKPGEIRFFLGDHYPLRSDDGQVRYVSTIVRDITERKKDVWLHDIVSVLPLNGEPQTLRGFMIDVTERKRAEYEGRQRRAELAHIGRVGTMGELAAAIAHEVNQPLAAIAANVEAAQRFMKSGKPDLKEPGDILDDIAADDKRAAEIIRRLRRLMKKGEMQSEPLDLNEMVREMLALVHTDLLIKGVTIEEDLARDLPIVHGDRVQVQQLLLNLVINASDAVEGLESGRQRIMVRTRSSGEQGVQLAVSDRGSGISEEKIEKIFQPFFSTKKEGLGMGLAINRTIIEAHGGRLWVENNRDQGATFYVTLPLSGAEGGLRDPMSKANPTVFVVDDDPSVRKGIGRLIRSAGIGVELFGSARAFLEREPVTGPACVVLDVQMPGLNGMELQEEMAARGMHTPIVFITGHGDIPMSVKAMKTGTADFLPKPYADNALLAAIKPAIEKDRRDRRIRAEMQDIHARLEQLTKREREVFDLVITGMLNKQIAYELGAAEKTIKVHRGRMMRKMNVVSVAGLVHLAEKAGVHPSKD